MPPAEPTQTLPFNGAERGAPSVAVVGGGLAGLVASCALSDSGFRVTLFERRPYLGGRASSYEHPATGEVVDNCQHVLFTLCTNLIAFYKKIGVDDKIRWFERMTFIEPGGRQSILEASALPAPLHVTPAFLRLPFLSAQDKFELTRALTALIIRPSQDDGSSFDEWLARHHQTRKAIECFWKPILVSALSEDLDRISVPYAAQVLRESMKSRDARKMGVPKIPLTALYDRARDYITAHHGVVRLRHNVRGFVPATSGVRLRLEDCEEEFDYAVVAVPFDALARLLPEAVESRELEQRLAHFEGSPITGVHLWFDRQITDLPHAVLLERTIQWMFHKSQLLEKDSEPGGNAAGEGTGGSYLELVISSSKSLIEKSRPQIIDLAVTELREFFPPAGAANLIKATVIKELNATFSPKPGIDRYRPPQQTGWPRVFLAGDWTATGWPATMEGAVRSGYQAAEEITKAAGQARRFLVADLARDGLMRIFA
jgi:squalene-associated FAD-dependent desaturase